MPQTSNSYTQILPNGNRVTVKVGSTRRSFYKTVTVRRPNGSSNNRTYRRGQFLAFFLGAYNQSIPKWAREPVMALPKSGQQGRVTSHVPTKRSITTRVAPVSEDDPEAWERFINQVRTSTKQIPSAVPPASEALGWQFVYFATELERCVDCYFSEYTDLMGGGLREYRLKTRAPLDFLSRSMDEIGELARQLAQPFDHSISTNDEADVIAIMARKFAHAYGSLVELCLYLRGVTSPSRNLDDACHALSVWPNPTFIALRQMIRQITSEMPTFAEQLQAGANPPAPKIGFVADLDDAARDRFKAAIENLKSEVS